MEEDTELDGDCDEDGESEIEELGEGLTESETEELGLCEDEGLELGEGEMDAEGLLPDDHTIEIVENVIEPEAPTVTI